MSTLQGCGIRGLVAWALIGLASHTFAENDRIFRAAASAVDITPLELPVRVNGAFLERTANQVHDNLHARCLILDDGSTEIAIVVVDSCMMPRALIDRAKSQAAAATGIRPDHMLISATHTHSAPAAMGCLGSRVDETYARWLPAQIAKAITMAHERRAPARIGWGTVDAPDMTFCRRWVMRTDRSRTNPLGQQGERAAMNPGYQNPDAVAPAGPVDPEITVLSVIDMDEQPVALLANFGMHYFGATALSADYFGRFDEIMTERFGSRRERDSDGARFVAMLSQGTSGDSHWRYYGRPAVARKLDDYTNAFADLVQEAHQSTTFHDWVPMRMEQTELILSRRVPDALRMTWAQAVVETIAGEAPKSLKEVYAMEQLYLHEDPEAALILQAIRIGDPWGRCAVRRWCGARPLRLLRLAG